MRSLAMPVAALALAACAPPDPTQNPPGAGTWQSMSTDGAPAPRVSHTAVWTGDEMIVWGGINPQEGNRYIDGGRYRPSLDAWTSMSTTDAPHGNVGHSAVYG